jgi:hypothetical protein
MLLNRLKAITSFSLILISPHMGDVRSGTCPASDVDTLRGTSRAFFKTRPGRAVIFVRAIFTHASIETQATSFLKYARRRDARLP